METSREDVGITIRSAFLKKGTRQRFSLLVLFLLSILLLFFETIETKPTKYFRSLVKDSIYRISVLASSPLKFFSSTSNFIVDHINLYNDFTTLKSDYENLKNKNFESDFLTLENNQLRKLIEEQIESPVNLVSARVMIDKQSPYLNSFIINIGTNKNIKNGMAVLDGKNFIGRIVDVNFFSSRVLLVSDLNSKIPVIIEPSGLHAILSGKNKKKPTLDYLPKNKSVNIGDKIYTSGKEGIFSPGIPIGQATIENDRHKIELFSNLNQITFVNIMLEKEKIKE